MTGSARELTVARGIFWGALLVGGVLRVRLALTDDGIFWPDEVYQSLEPAHRLVHGYGFVAWEFLRGARSWAFPGFVAGLLWVAKTVGWSSPGAYLLFVRLCFAALSVCTALSVQRLARRSGASPLGAASAGAAWALGALFIYFSPRAMGENAAALLACAGLAEALPPEATRRARWLGTALLGLSVFLRLQNAVLCVALLGVLAWRRRPRPWVEAAAVLLLTALLFGLFDRLTWGSWFHSAREYLVFNLVEGKASLWGTSGPAFYANALYRSAPALAWVGGALALLGARRSPALAVAALLFLVLHHAVPHKEVRFLLPILPALCALVGLGVSVLPEVRLRYGATAALVLASAASAARHRTLTFGDLGQYEGAKSQVSAYDDFGPVNRLLLRASALPDLCGLQVAGVHLAWTGGYSHLHRRVPFYGGGGAPPAPGQVSHVIAPLAWLRGGARVASDGAFVLARVRNGECLPDPAFSWKLP